MSVQTRFRLLGTYVVLSTGDPAEAARAEDLTRTVLDDVDAVASRFRPDSDLARVNDHAGSWVEVDPLLVWMVKAAIEAARATQGLVDPLVGHHVRALGYDRDFAALSRDIARGLPARRTPSAGAWQRIELTDDRLMIPADTALDLGATGKAFAVDAAAQAMSDHLDGDWCLSVGGEVRARGSWPIAVSTLAEGPVDQTIELHDGALATSSTASRRWRAGGRDHHHLIDPHTGASVITPWELVTVVDSTCVAANTAALGAILVGKAGPTWLQERGVSARLKATDGSVRLVGDWPEADDD